MGTENVSGTVSGGRICPSGDAILFSVLTGAGVIRVASERGLRHSSGAVARSLDRWRYADEEWSWASATGPHSPPSRNRRGRT